VRITAVDGLLIRHFDDEAVVFDPVSWDAHLLNPAAIAVLELLLDAPRSENEVIEFFADALRFEEQPHAVAHAHRLIGELRSLGLIRPAECAATNANLRDP
jgi:PqqD family protein of HPr-rel-A system